MQNTLNCRKSYKIQLSTIEIAVAEWGSEDGQPIIALHGWLDNMASFYPLLTHSDWLMTNNIRLIVIDWPGHGHSDHRHASHQYYLLEYVQDLHDFINAVQLSEVILLGHSLGGAIATLFSGSFPESVQGLILIEAIGPLTLQEEKSPEQLAKSIRQRNRHQDRKSIVYEDLKQVVKARMKNTDLNEKQVELLIERNMKKTDKGFLWRSDPRLRLPSPFRFSESQSRAFIKNLSMPVLLLYGKDGFVNHFPELTKMVAANQRIETLQLDGGHHLHMQFPEQVVQAIETFLDNKHQPVKKSLGSSEENEAVYSLQS